MRLGLTLLMLLAGLALSVFVWIASDGGLGLLFLPLILGLPFVWRRRT